MLINKWAIHWRVTQITSSNSTDTFLCRVCEQQANYQPITMHTGHRSCEEDKVSEWQFELTAPRSLLAFHL